MTQRVSNKQMIFEIIYYSIVCIVSIFAGYYLSRYGIIFLNKADGKIPVIFQDEDYIITREKTK